MKNKSLLAILVLLLAACSAKKSENASTTDSLSQKLSSTLITNLQDSSNNTASGKIKRSFFRKDLSKMDSTFTLTPAQIDQIKASIDSEIASQSLSSSSELNSVLPAVVAGAENALNLFTDKTATEKLSIIKVLSQSAVTAVSTYSSYAIDTADTDNASKEAELIKDISKTIVSHADQAGFAATDLSTLSATVTSSIVVNIDSAGISIDKLNEAIKLAASGAILGINDLSAKNMTGFTASTAEGALQSITTGAISSFGEIKAITSASQMPELVKNFTSHMTGSIDLLTSLPSLDVTTAQSFVKTISTGATKAIGSISRSDLSVNDLPTLAKNVSEGAVSGLNYISVSGFSSSNLPSFVKNVVEGSVVALSQITTSNYDTSKYASMIENINEGATQALAVISISGYSTSQLPTLVESIASGSTGVLDTLLEGQNPSLLTTMVTSISKGSSSALDNLNTAGVLDLNAIPDMAKSISKGATTALQNISMTGYTSTIMEGMITSISKGTAEGFTSASISGFDSTKMLTVMSSISAGATEGIITFTSFSYLTSGTFNSTQALSNVATGLASAAYDLSSTYTISSNSLSTAINTAMNTYSGSVTVPSDLTTTISTSYTAGPMIYGAFFQDTDTDQGQVAGTLTIQRPMYETDIQSYRIYFGVDPKTKSGNAIAEIQKASLSATDTFFKYDIAANTTLPQNVYYLIIYTVTNSESSYGYAVPIYDLTSSVGSEGSSYTYPTATSTPSSSQTSTETNPQGTWKTACISTGSDSSFQVTMTFNNGVYTSVSKSYSDSSCNTVIDIYESIANYTLPGLATIPANSYKINLTQTSATDTPKTVSFASDLNSQAQCGITNWQVDQPTSVYNLDCGFGIHNDYYSVFQIVGSNLYLGKEDATYTGYSESLRNQSLEMSISFIKQP